MKFEIIYILICWIIAFIIYGIWNKYINGDIKRNGNKRVRKKEKIKK